MRRPNPYQNVSLAPPEPLQANFGAPPPMVINPPPMSAPEDAGGQIAGLGQSLVNLKQRFGGKQGSAIKDALTMGAAGKA
jgi:hypothetical protein